MAKSALARIHPPPPVKKGSPRFGAPATYRLTDEPDGLVFAARLSSSATYYYREALQKLEDEGGALVFDSKKPVASLKNAAKRLGYVLLFAERDGKLYVKIGGQTDPAPAKSKGRKSNAAA